MSLVLGASLAASAPPRGFYRGTIGGVAVSVCFDVPLSEETSMADSRYYADEVGQTVELWPFGADAEPDPEEPVGRLPKAGDWMEVEPMHGRSAEFWIPAHDPWWSEIRLDGARLTGTRHAVAKLSPSPGRLVYDEAAGAEEATQAIALSFVNADCAGFEASRLDRSREVVRSEKHGSLTVDVTRHPLTRIEAATAVRGLDPEAAAKISRVLLDAVRDLDREWFGCADFDAWIAPALVTRRLLVFTSGVSDPCGVPHPREASSTWSFDGATGEPFDLVDWLAPGAWKVGPAGVLRDALYRSMVETNGDDECAKHRDEIGWWEIVPSVTAGGVVFWVPEPDRSMLPCQGDYRVSFADLRLAIAEEHRAEYDALVSAVRGAESTGN